MNRDPRIDELLCLVGISQPLASIEDFALNPDKPSPVMAYSPVQQEMIKELTGHETKYRLKISHTHTTNILNGVRSQVLDWSLKLESAGILGENMSFKHDERQAAQTLS